MIVTVDRVSRFGFKAVGHEGWFNPDRTANPDFSTIRTGMTLDIVNNGQYVRSFTITSDTTPRPDRTPAPQHLVGGHITGMAAPPVISIPNNRDEVITRTAVVKSVLENPGGLTLNTQERDSLILKYVSYCMTGNGLGPITATEIMGLTRPFVSNSIWDSTVDLSTANVTTTSSEAAPVRRRRTTIQGQSVSPTNGS